MMQMINADKWQNIFVSNSENETVTWNRAAMMTDHH